ncbi:MAG: hypothetical protein KDA28_13285, partial [Phycisphaerales bacterium]|nr:hypothetical protein [Phycisphaerales bacterium]
MLRTIVLLVLASLASGQVTIENYEGPTTLRYPLALIRGTATNGDAVTIRNESNACADGTVTTPIRMGHYVGFVALKPGTNHITLVAGGHTARLDLTYEPLMRSKIVNVIYVTAADGETRYPTPDKDDPQNYADRLDLAARLLQTFTAERLNDLGLGRRTFRLDLDEHGHVRVHTIRWNRTRQDLKAMAAPDLWAQLKVIVEEKFDPATHKNIVVIGFTSYDTGAMEVEGHAALGGGSLALFSNIGLFSWPATIQDIHLAFTDDRPVSNTVVPDDSAGRRRRWAQCATTMGAVLHELGHT